MAHGRVGDLDEAISDLNRALNLDHENPAVLRTILVLADSWAEKDSLSEAERLYKEILTADAQAPGNSESIRLDAMAGLIDVYAKVDRHDEAKRVYAEMLETSEFATYDDYTLGRYVLRLPGLYRQLGSRISRQTWYIGSEVKNKP